MHTTHTSGFQIKLHTSIDPVSHPNWLKRYQWHQRKPSSTPTSSFPSTKQSHWTPQQHHKPCCYKDYITPREPWEEPLWHDIQLHAHINTLRTQLINTTCIIIVSNAAVHADNRGTCTWTIWSNTKLWTGEGFVPGNPDDMYSGLAEAYRIYTALSFLHQYCIYYALISQQQWMVHIYCNNQVYHSVIHGTLPMRCNQWWLPNFADIDQFIKALAPLHMKLHHIQGQKIRQTPHTPRKIKHWLWCLCIKDGQISPTGPHPTKPQKPLQLSTPLGSRQSGDLTPSAHITWCIPKPRIRDLPSG